MTREEYREQQKKFKEMRKVNQRFIWVSKDKTSGLLKGRTYINLEKLNSKKGK